MRTSTTAAWQPGQALFVGFEGLECPRPLLELIAAGRIGGVVLFARNVEAPAQVRKLVASMRERAPQDAPLVVAIDQEGGRVQRLRKPWTEWPPMRRVGEAAQLESTAALARSLALELRELGIGLDFAPVVDVDSNPANPIIGDRSFSRDAATVGRYARSFIEAMQAERVACCAKHFPGHGDTELDSHLALPKLAHDLDRLFEVELPPFAAAIAGEVASIMTAHVVFEAIDRTRPASFAPDVIALLRERLGHDGVVFSDDLEMKAVADHWQPREMVDAALTAGVDALLVCRRFDFVTEVLERLERQKDNALEHALARVVAFKRRFPGEAPAETPLGPPYPAHAELAERLLRGDA
ncbi:MAG: beta-N-acetylhexosaminidase [Deltaproteobacteria bacterium]|nr:beta-N-acetylhexosaminidase [Deltaproteobacteria bacterium]MBK8714611.1 beta-N-acetylhexosaminidase [Deltaproteobacteria bacterium]MBP7292176.1 beta-N-acetylhexosaminidase [Nannocystaceae bacterium]